MQHDCPPKLVLLYQRALLCKEFPAYRLDELRNLPAGDILRAMELLSLARQAQG